jgi:hypothetical protein
MKKLTFSIDVSASQEKAFNTMIGAKTYPVWTSVFNPHSHFVGDWSQGSKILFVGADKDGNKGGMVARIAVNRPFEHISIEHYGMLEGDREITEGENIAQWAGAHENYTFTRVGDKTRITVDMDTVEAFESFFQDSWPKSLEKLKSLCES